MLYTLLLRLIGRRVHAKRRLPHSATAIAPLLLTLWVAALCGAHMVAMVVFEALPPADAIWLTLTTVTTVGFGDIAPASLPGRIATILLLYIGAIVVVARAINDWFEAKQYRIDRKLRGLWDWNMKNHLVIISDLEQVWSLQRTSDYLERLVRHIQDCPGWSNTPVQLLTNAFQQSGLPSNLLSLGVTHYSGIPTHYGSLEAVHPDAARAVIILANHDTRLTCDSVTFDVVDRIRDLGFTGPIVAECVDERNRSRMLRAGATTVVRPIRGYPELLAHALFAPGTEEILTNLFDVHGNECHRITLDHIWQGDWKTLSGRVLEAGIGTPLAVADDQGRVLVNPVSRGTLSIRAVYVLIDHALKQPTDRVNKALLR